MSITHEEKDAPVNETDESLLWQLKQGDGSPFDTLFLRYYERVYRVVYHLVGTREEAEDMVQETFLALYHHPPERVPETGLGAWLCRVALNKGYNSLRSRQRAHQREVYTDISPAENDPYTAAVRAEERGYVRSLLTRLPERQSRILLLRYAGLSYAEIAATLDIATGSVGTLLARAERAFLAKAQDVMVEQT